MSLKCNAVFEGGGVRGIGHVGAASVLENYGYKMQNYVGSSAGAIVAALLACGYSAAELKTVIEEMDFRKFRQSGLLSRFGIPGKTLSVLWTYGIYSSDYFEKWMQELLEAKGKTVFGDLKTANTGNKREKWKLQITASDVTNQRLLILPGDLELFGINPDDFSIATAVRMSMSIPIYFKPYRLIDHQKKEHLIVDGGLLSNYPVWLFDSEGLTGMPTIGFKFIDAEGKYECSHEPFSADFPCYMKMLISTALDAADKQHISQSGGDFERTIGIPVVVNENGKMVKISSVDFDITPEQTELLYQNGVTAAKKFLKYWSHELWTKKYISS